MRIAQRLSTWRALGPEKRWTVLGHMMALPVVAVLIRVMGVMRTVRLAERTSVRQPPRSATQRDIDSARSLMQLTQTAGTRGPVDASCLRQSVWVYWLLRRRGLSPKLQIGVRRLGDDLDAHAWVEFQGNALGAGPESHVIIGQLNGHPAVS